MKIFRVLIILTIFLTFYNFKSLIADIPGKIENVEIESTGEITKVIISLSKTKFDYKIDRFPSPNRIIIHFKNTFLGDLEKNVKLDYGTIKNISFKEFKKDNSINAELIISVSEFSPYFVIEEDNIISLQFENSANLSIPKKQLKKLQTTSALEKPVEEAKPIEKEKSVAAENTVEKPVKEEKPLLISKKEDKPVEIKPDPDIKKPDVLKKKEPVEEKNEIKTTEITDIKVQEKEGQSIITISSSQSVDYKMLELPSKHYLILDIPYAELKIKDKTIELNGFTVNRIRSGLYQKDPFKIVRIVVELKENRPYFIDKKNFELILTIDNESALPPSETVPIPVSPKIVKKADIKPAEVQQKKVETKADVKPKLDNQQSKSDKIPNNKNTIISKPLETTISKTKTSPPLKQTIPPISIIPKKESVQKNEKNSKAEISKNDEKLISLDFKNIEIGNALRMLSTTTNVNIITSSEIKGSITIRIDKVPWETALSNILEINGFAYRKKGNIIYVAKKETIKTEINNNSNKKNTQIIIEALLVDISILKINQLGINWIVGNSNNIYSDIQSQESGMLAIGTLSSSKEFKEIILKQAKDKDLNVLSNLRIPTLDNEDTRISLENQVPVELNNQNIKLVPVGVKLKVKPSIISNENIMMKIHPEVSAVKKSLIEGMNVEIATSEIETNIMVKNGQSVVIGGLLRREENKTNSGVPIYKRIPLFGSLFSDKTVEQYSGKRELIIFVTPYIGQ
ncbi:AMIN domain-containing protein [Candidatus Desantisbacteria bacterium]|nr:AMIN domain-containing protein [Candidatus Desantisbacteria bacterium]